MITIETFVMRLLQRSPVPLTADDVAKMLVVGTKYDANEVYAAFVRLFETGKVYLDGEYLKTDVVPRRG